MKFQRISPQFIAALGDPEANAGNGAQSWGLWPVDPGPRGVRLSSFAQLKAAGGGRPAGWKFDATDVVAGGTRLDHGAAFVSGSSRQVPGDG
jgi:hypothetical protein